MATKKSGVFARLRRREEIRKHWAQYAIPEREPPYNRRKRLLSPDPLSPLRVQLGALELTEPWASLPGPVTFLGEEPLQVVWAQNEELLLQTPIEPDEHTLTYQLDRRD